MLRIYIFSFNRAAFLRNCIASIQSYAPSCPLTVVDDNSTDPETRAVLADLPQMGVRLIQQATHLNERHGGLYANMQLALDSADEGDRVLFIQDDMQLVRPLDEADFRYIDDFYAAFPKAAFLNPVFLKGQRNRRDRRITRINPDFPVYFRHYPSKKTYGGLAYTDAVIGDVSRLRAVNWRFTQSEVANADSAMRHFGLMGFMACPFVMFLPQVPVYRGKRKSWAVRIAERRVGEAPKTFEPMSPADLRRFKQRDLSVLPVAEHFLNTRDRRVKKPFEYSAVNVFPLLHGIHRIEDWLHRKFRRD